MTRRWLMSVLLTSAFGALGAPAGARAQMPPAALIAEARKQIDALNVDSAGRLLVQALDPRAGATKPERIRALVLLGAVEVIVGRPEGARRAFREALTLDPDLRVDSLASLHTYLVTAFDAVRAGMTASNQPPPSILELTGLPDRARIVVDGRPWVGTRQEVEPGLHHIEATADGFAALRDSVFVGPGVTVIRSISLTAIPIVPPVPDSTHAGAPSAEARGALGTRASPVAPGRSTPGLEYGFAASLTSLDQALTTDSISDFFVGASARVGYAFGGGLGARAAATYGFSASASLVWASLSFTYTFEAGGTSSLVLIGGAGTTWILYTGGGERHSRVGLHYGLGWRQRVSNTAAVQVEAISTRENFTNGFGAAKSNWMATAGLAVQPSLRATPYGAGTASTSSAQTQSRPGRIEVTMLATGVYADKSLADWTRSGGYVGATLAVGAYLERHLGVAAGITYGQGHEGNLLMPCVSLSAYPFPDLRTLSPYVIAGLGLSRISTNYWGKFSSTETLQAGLGLRSFVSRDVAIRLEGRLLSGSYLGSNSYSTPSTLSIAALVGTSISFGARR